MKRLGFILMTSVLALSACSHVKETLGMQRTSPDEFTVVERAPLTVPPNFDLTPPQPGAARPQDQTTTNSAKGLVLGSQSSAPKADNSSPAEQALLNKVGAANGDPKIRQELMGPDTTPGDKETVAQKLGISSTDANGKALDPTDEAARLQKANVKAPPVKADDGQSSNAQ